MKRRCAEVCACAGAASANKPPIAPSFAKNSRRAGIFMRTSTLGRTTARSLWAGWAAIEPEIFEINPSFCKTDECGRLLAAVVNNADAAPLDRNVQSRKTIHAAPLLLNREMCGCDL